MGHSRPPESRPGLAKWEQGPNPKLPRNAALPVPPTREQGQNCGEEEQRRQRAASADANAVAPTRGHDAAPRAV
eukprot:8392075-Alexandrium_andersonii.AAC.1